jgi:hypothetical protein
MHALQKTNGTGKKNETRRTSCEGLADNPDSLESDTAIDEILKMFDNRLQYKIAGLPETFREYPHKDNRKTREAMFL